MGRGDLRRRLIVNADDFGDSPSANQAVETAHREGILTTASLMVNGAASAEAVQTARRNPHLGVGLHLTLVCGSAALPRDQIPGLIQQGNEFSHDPVLSGMRYFFQRSLVPQLEREIAAQIDKFRQTGLLLDHVNGHLNLHLHPTVFRILMQHARSWGIRGIRLTRDPFRINARLAGGHWFYRLSHTVVFHSLSRWARPQLDRQGIRHTARVFGLLQSGRVTEAYVRGLLSRLPGGDSELYSHPSLDKAKAEVDALVSPTVRGLVQEHSIQLIRYQDL
jgi:hopanoid biosynthesis associated protein HpnK